MGLRLHAMHVTRILCGCVLAVAVLPAAAFAQRVTKVPSGDTIVIDGVGKVRLLGLRNGDDPAVRWGNTSSPTPQAGSGRRMPESPVVGGSISLKPERPSRTFLQQLVLGKTVRLQYDPLAKVKDRAYVFLEDETLVNAEMLRTGHARVDLSLPFAHEEEFKRLEAEAQRADLGIWMKVIR
jgi:endonuclease YncB( thermonuclease family)